MLEDTKKLDLEELLTIKDNPTPTILDHHKMITLSEQELLLLTVESQMEVTEMLSILVYLSEIFDLFIKFF